jgi:hypothetical protein
MKNIDFLHLKINMKSVNLVRREIVDVSTSTKKLNQLRLQLKSTIGEDVRLISIDEISKVIRSKKSLLKLLAIDKKSELCDIIGVIADEFEDPWAESNVNININGISRVIKLLGSGYQGQVYFIDGFGNYAYKKIFTKKMLIKEEGSSYTLSNDLVEIVALAMMRDFASGKIPNSFGLFIHEGVAYHMCNDGIVIITELEDDSLANMVLDQKFTAKELKVLVFQCCFVIISISKLKYTHNDTYLKNFFVRKLSNASRYNELSIGDARYWIVDLDQKRYEFINIGYVAKIADFGAMNKLSTYSDPVSFVGEQNNIGETRDLGIFLIDLYFGLKGIDEYNTMFIDLTDTIIDLTGLEPANWGRLVVNSKENPYPALTSNLLDSKFFNEIMKTFARD